MNLKEKQGREEMIESAKQVLISLRKLRDFPETIIGGVKREHGLSQDFLTVNLGTIIKSLEGHYFLSQGRMDAMVVRHTLNSYVPLSVLKTSECSSTPATSKHKSSSVK